MEARKMYERDIGYTAPEVRRERKWEREGGRKRGQGRRMEGDNNRLPNPEVCLCRSFAPSVVKSVQPSDCPSLATQQEGSVAPPRYQPHAGRHQPHANTDIRPALPQLLLRPRRLRPQLFTRWVVPPGRLLRHLIVGTTTL